MSSISVILLAGGKGSRMRSDTPKQFLLLGKKPIAQYSFDLFLQLDEVEEIVVVCDSSYQNLFKSDVKPIVFAEPGERRQDSVYNGLKQAASHSKLICIHDSARPFIKKAFIQKAFLEADLWGASVVGVPVKYTVKLSDSAAFVKETLDRSKVWEMQTPQVIKKEWLEAGFAYAIQNQITVTDDVSLVELLHKPVKLVQGDYTNIKITTPDDLIFGEMILKHE